MLTTVKFDEIKTPTTVEEFRENLHRYYMPYGSDALYVNANDTCRGVPLKDISSFGDIYTLTKSGFGGDGTSPMITPLLDFEMESEIRRHMSATGQIFSCEGYWEHPDSDFTIYDFTQSTRSALFGTNLVWYTLDNQILREFYIKTLGAFCGYGSANYFDRPSQYQLETTS